MKKYICILFVLFVSIAHAYAQEYKINFNVGTPINKSLDWNKLNFSVDLSLGKKITEKSIVGVGASYLRADLTSSNTYLTYDRGIFNVFVYYAYDINISKSITVIPQINFGYAFIEYELNEFLSDKMQTNGFSISEEINIRFNYSEKISFITGLSLNSIFSEFTNDPNLIIPAIYIGNDKKIINQLKINIGIIHKF